MDWGFYKITSVQDSLALELSRCLEEGGRMIKKATLIPND